MEYLSYDELIQYLVELRCQEDEKAWEFAAACAVALDRYKAKATDIAAQVNCSARHVRNMAKTFLAFPVDEERNKELTISHHLVCAGTETPRAWLERAEQEQLSVRQLKEAIGQGKEKDPAQEAQKVWAKLVKILEAGGPGAEYLKEQLNEYYEEVA